MLFNSYVFIFLLLPISLIIYYLCNHLKKYTLAKISLILSSLIFYGYYNPKYVLVILISVFFNYMIHFFMDKYNNKKIIFLLLGLFVNLGALFYFKYFNFFIENINIAFKTDFVIKNIVLPLGISFFTFQQLSYVIDSYRGKVPNYNIIDYSLFVMFFPQLVAGPIVLHSQMIPQFQDKENKKINFDNFSKGIISFTLGLAKKVLIADVFSIVVLYGYSNISSLSSPSAILVMLAYTFQIYFDFSGYSDMALGIGLMFNIKLPINFNSPYKAKSIPEFWKRWNMTLTNFFTEYLYIPLGGNRKGKVRMYVNTLIVFLLSGLWHGANWTFVLWGLLYGVALCIHKFFKNSFDKLGLFVNWFITFLFVNFAWVFFRAGSFKTAVELFKKIFDFSSLSISGITNSLGISELKFINWVSGGAYYSIIIYLFITILFGGSLLLCVFGKNTQEYIKNFKPTFKNSLFIAILLFLCVISFSGVSEFLYFDF